MSERFEGWVSDSNPSVVIVFSGDVAKVRNSRGFVFEVPASTPGLRDPETWSPMEPSEARKFFQEASAASKDS